jgi:hypothetical protein
MASDPVFERAYQRQQLPIGIESAGTPSPPLTMTAAGSSASLLNTLDDGAEMSGPRWRLSRAGVE